MKVNTLLFDFDGTLVDTNNLILTSLEHTLQQFFPNRFSREDLLEFIGPPLHESFKKLAPDQLEDMVQTYRKHNHEHHDLLVKEFEGVHETIDLLHSKGFKLGIVTTKIRATVQKGLVLTNLDKFFDVMVALDDVKNAKPDPEPIEKALQQLHAKPEEAIMVGDNHHDILAGKNAGTYTAGVAWSMKGKAYMESYQPDFVLDHMSDLVDIVGVEPK